MRQVLFGKTILVFRGNKFEKLPTSQLGPPRHETATLGDSVLAVDTSQTWDC
jgi:hypothetical protein